MLKFLQLLIVGLIGQFLPHPANFSPLNSIGLFSRSYLNSPLSAFLMPLSFAFIKDLIIGFHSTMFFVYLSLFLVILLGNKFTVLSLSHTVKFSLCSTFIFFFITNFGVWLTSSLYPLTLKGFVLCYSAAFPFLMNQLLGDIFYGFLFYEICSNQLLFKKKAVLLSS